MAGMDARRQFATQTALVNLVRKAMEDSRAEVMAEFGELGTDGLIADFGGQRFTIRLVQPKAQPAAYEDEPEFLEFMRAKGMTEEAVRPEWCKHAAVVDGRVVWAETGEVVPRAYVTQGAPYARLKETGTEAYGAILCAARDSGFLGSVVAGVLEAGEPPVIEVEEEA